MRIYVASSWRNSVQPAVVAEIREKTKNEVYDFREPQGNGARGFHWSEIDPDWESWNATQFKKGLTHKLAVKGFDSDMAALESAGATLLVLPCGKSAHLELGAARGFGQHTAIYMPEDAVGHDRVSPKDVVAIELMYKMVDELLVSLAEVTRWAKRLGKEA